MAWWEVGWEGQGEEENLDSADCLDRAFLSSASRQHCALYLSEPQFPWLSNSNSDLING